jgi:hypothetical protein
MRSVQTENVSRNAVCDALMGKVPNPVLYWTTYRREYKKFESVKREWRKLQ